MQVYTFYSKSAQIMRPQLFIKIGNTNKSENTKYDRYTYDSILMQLSFLQCDCVISV